MLIDVRMTSKPVYYTNKTAIIIGAVISLGAGIAVGATFVANMIDQNSLAEYRNNPKVSSLVTLSDDATGHSLGWNPGISPIEYKEGSATIKDNREIVQFDIKDETITTNSMVHVVYTENRQVYAAIGVSPHMAMIEIPCTTVPNDGGFTAYCGTDNQAPREGAQLKYFAISPQ